MKKRIVCVLLTLIMLVGMLPLSASAAGRAISENAITILKQLEGYKTNCNGKGSTFGYGTICTNEKEHKKYHSEKEADTALRQALKDLDNAVNNFATKKGLSLTQGKHDALVLFSFQNGTAWTTGTGDFQSAIVSGKIGTDFLNAICRWKDADAKEDERRMIEANMYLNGVYSSTRPANYIWVTYNAKSGVISEAPKQYYDVSNKPAPHLVPTRENYTFTGWLVEDTAKGIRNAVTQLTSAHHGAELIAGWVGSEETATPLAPTNLAYPHVIELSQLTSGYVYTYNAGKKAFDIYLSAQVQNVSYFYVKDTNTLRIDALHRDKNGQLWGRLVDNGYVLEYWVAISGTGSTGNLGDNIAYIDVTVTVTNSHVNMRENASIGSRVNGSFSKGNQLRIINTANGSGFLWGQVAAGPMDNTPIGWVALMYTNFDAVRDNPETSKPVNNSTAIATAVISHKGYVNVRSGAGTDNQIVGALAYDTEVSIYETKFVNGQEWGRCNVGWFCLNYAKVQRLVKDTSYTTDVGFTSYVFTGKLKAKQTETNQTIYKSIGGEKIDIKDVKAVLGEKAVWDDVKLEVTVSNLIEKNNVTWGKCALGWVKLTDNLTYASLDVTLDVAKYLVSAESVTVRAIPNVEGVRNDTLVKNVEFNVNETHPIVVVGDTVWGYASKVGENNATYNGWVNLANKYVTRNGVPSVNTSGTVVTGPVKMAKVINTSNVKVRVTGATYGRQIGTLAAGTTAMILEEQNGWYNLDIDVDGDPSTGSWVAGTYLDIYESTATGTTTGTSGSTTAAVQTGMGVVANTYSGVNVRSGAGTGYAPSGKLLPGTAVEILEVVDKGTAKWGRTVQGWVCMDYITMVSNYPIAGTTTPGTSNNTTGNTTTSSEPAIFTGTTKAKVNVRKTPSLQAEIVRELEAGAPITMHELLAVTEEVKTSTSTTDQGAVTTTKEETSYWARINDGYIYAPGQHLNLDSVDEYVYTVTGIDTQNVRTGAGTDQPKADFKLVKGDQVKVTKLQIVKNGMWGFIECDKGTGWASMLYMTKGAVTIQPETTPNTNTGTTNTAPSMGLGSNVGGYVSNASGYRYTGKVINTNAVNVRATASTSAAITTQLKYGQAIVVYETTIAENMAWGRCDAGWVYLYYVDLTPVVNGAVDARVVYNENTIIYTDVNGSGVAGTYARMSVIDIYEIVGSMARTDKGWVNVNDLL